MTQPLVSPKRRDTHSVLRTLFRSPKVLWGLSILAFFALVAIFGPGLLVYDASDVAGPPHMSPNLTYPLGTSGQGEDILSQMVVGARTSLGIGFTIAIVVTVIGALIGLLSAYFGSVTDNVLSAITNIFITLPGLPLLIALTVFLPPGPITTIGVLSLLGWAGTARIIRAQGMSIRGRDYIKAAIATGESVGRILIREIAPNLFSVLAGTFVGAAIYGIAAQAGLEFLGLGGSTLVSWGTILHWSDVQSAILLGEWWTFVPPGVCLGVVGLALTLVMFGADEITNPALRRRKGTGTNDVPKNLFSSRLSTPVWRR